MKSFRLFLFFFFIISNTSMVFADDKKSFLRFEIPEKPMTHLYESRGLWHSLDYLKYRIEQLPFYNGVGLKLQFEFRAQEMKKAYEELLLAEGVSNPSQVEHFKNKYSSHRHALLMLMENHQKYHLSLRELTRTFFSNQSIDVHHEIWTIVDAEQLELNKALYFLNAEMMAGQDNAPMQRALEAKVAAWSRAAQDWANLNQKILNYHATKQQEDAITLAKTAENFVYDSVRDAFLKVAYFSDPTEGESSGLYASISRIEAISLLLQFQVLQSVAGKDVTAATARNFNQSQQRQAILRLVTTGIAFTDLVAIVFETILGGSVSPQHLFVTTSLVAVAGALWIRNGSTLERRSNQALEQFNHRLTQALAVTWATASAEPLIDSKGAALMGALQALSAQFPKEMELLGCARVLGGAPSNAKLQAISQQK